MGTEALNVRPKNNELIVSVDFLKTNFLFGVDLRDDDGNEMPESMHEFYIRSATTWMEDELATYFRPVTITNEAHDFHYNDYIQYNFLRLFCRPARRLTSLSLEFPVSLHKLEFDPAWFRLESSTGYVSVIPSQGSISKFIIGAGGTFLPALHAHSHLPFVFRADYEAGYNIADIPIDILEVVGMKASLGALNIAGDLIAGAGIATKSISLDGLSQSIGTTSSATNAGYGARIIQYSKEIKDRLEILKGKYRGISMVVG